MFMLKSHYVQEHVTPTYYKNIDNWAMFYKAVKVIDIVLLNNQPTPNIGEGAVLFYTVGRTASEPPV